MYQTSPLDPAVCVPKLCYKHTSESILLGSYTHTGNKVTGSSTLHCIDHVFQCHITVGSGGGVADSRGFPH